MNIYTVSMIQIALCYVSSFFVFFYFSVLQIEESKNLFEEIKKKIKPNLLMAIPFIFVPLAFTGSMIDLYNDMFIVKIVQVLSVIVVVCVLNVAANAYDKKRKIKED